MGVTPAVGCGAIEMGVSWLALFEESGDDEHALSIRRRQNNIVMYFVIFGVAMGVARPWLHQIYLTNF